VDREVWDLIRLVVPGAFLLWLVLWRSVRPERGASLALSATPPPVPTEPFTVGALVFDPRERVVRIEGGAGAAEAIPFSDIRGVTVQRNTYWHSVQGRGDAASTELQASLLLRGGSLPLHRGDEEGFWTVTDAVCALTGTSWEMLPEVQHDRR
jgi:hypothetical protein